MAMLYGDDGLRPNTTSPPLFSGASGGTLAAATNASAGRIEGSSSANRGTPPCGGGVGPVPTGAPSIALPGFPPPLLYSAEGSSGGAGSFGTEGSSSRSSPHDGNQVLLRLQQMAHMQQMQQQMAQMQQLQQQLQLQQEQYQALLQGQQLLDHGFLPTPQDHRDQQHDAGPNGVHGVHGVHGVDGGNGQNGQDAWRRASHQQPTPLPPAPPQQRTDAISCPPPLQTIQTSIQGSAGLLQIPTAPGLTLLGKQPVDPQMYPDYDNDLLRLQSLSLLQSGDTGKATQGPPVSMSSGPQLPSSSGSPPQDAYLSRDLPPPHLDPSPSLAPSSSHPLSSSSPLPTQTHQAHQAQQALPSTTPLPPSPQKHKTPAASPSQPSAPPLSPKKTGRLGSVYNTIRKAASTTMRRSHAAYMHELPKPTVAPLATLRDAASIPMMQQQLQQQHQTLNQHHYHNQPQLLEQSTSASVYHHHHHQYKGHLDLDAAAAGFFPLTPPLTGTLSSASSSSSASSAAGGDETASQASAAAAGAAVPRHLPYLYHDDGGDVTLFAASCGGGVGTNDTGPWPPANGDDVITEVGNDPSPDDNNNLTTNGTYFGATAYIGNPTAALAGASMMATAADAASVGQVTMATFEAVKREAEAAANAAVNATIGSGDEDWWYQSVVESAVGAPVAGDDAGATTTSAPDHSDGSSDGLLMSGLMINNMPQQQQDAAAAGGGPNRQYYYFPDIHHSAAAAAASSADYQILLHPQYPQQQQQQQMPMYQQHHLSGAAPLPPPPPPVEMEFRRDHRAYHRRPKPRAPSAGARHQREESVGGSRRSPRKPRTLSGGGGPSPAAVEDGAMAGTITAPSTPRGRVGRVVDGDDADSDYTSATSTMLGPRSHSLQSLNGAAAALSLASGGTGSGGRRRPSASVSPSRVQGGGRRRTSSSGSGMNNHAVGAAGASSQMMTPSSSAGTSSSPIRKQRRASGSAGGAAAAASGKTTMRRQPSTQGLVAAAEAAAAAAAAAEAHHTHASASSSSSFSRPLTPPPAGQDIGFVNYTPDDHDLLMTGVAPSGSSKTKARREREMQEKTRKFSEQLVQMALATGRNPIELEQLGM